MLNCAFIFGTMEEVQEKTQIINITRIQTPIGELISGVGDSGLYLLDFEYRKLADANYKRIQNHHCASFTEQRHAYHDIVEKQLAEYFQGIRTAFDLEIRFSGSTFQQSVWDELLKIPFGTTRTYKQQSQLLGNEKAIRAVASANGDNCIAIIVPCHRVIGGNGSLTGYAGGLHRKKWLLEHEARISGKGSQPQLF